MGLPEDVAVGKVFKMKLASFLAIFILVSGRRVHSFTLNVNLISKSGTNIVKPIPFFSNQADLRVYLKRLAEESLDDIAQDLASKLEGGFVLQQQPNHTTAFKNYTQTILKPDEYAVNSQATLCSVKCGDGKRIYAKVNCNNEDQEDGKVKCDQSLVSTEEDCNLGPCPDNNYGQWSSWTLCSMTCKRNVNERSIKLRIRTCTTPDGQPCPSFEERRECKEVGFCAPECPLLTIKEFRKEGVAKDALFTGIFEVENPRVSFGNNLKKKNIEIKCTSNGETIPKENINISTNEQTNVTTYGVPGLRLRLTYQPIISFKSEIDVSQKNSSFLQNVFENTCVGRPFTVDFFTCDTWGKNQLWKLEGDKLKNKNGDLALSDVKIPDEGDQGHIKGQTPQDQTLKGQNDKIIGLVDEKIKLEDTNSQTEKEYDWKRKKEDEEFFTLESGSTPKQF